MAAGQLHPPGPHLCCWPWPGGHPMWPGLLSVWPQIHGFGGLVTEVEGLQDLSRLPVPRPSPCRGLGALGVLHGQEITGICVPGRALSRDPGPPVSDESPVGWRLVGVASARSQLWGSLAAAASRPGSELGAGTSHGIPGGGQDEVLVSGGHGPHPLSDPNPQALLRMSQVNTACPVKPLPEKPSLVGAGFPRGRPVWVSMVCTQRGYQGTLGPRR